MELTAPLRRPTEPRVPPVATPVTAAMVVSEARPEAVPVEPMVWVETVETVASPETVESVVSVSSALMEAPTVLLVTRAVTVATAELAALVARVAQESPPDSTP